jgi:hypothetical protein
MKIKTILQVIILILFLPGFIISTFSYVQAYNISDLIYTLCEPQKVNEKLTTRGGKIPPAQMQNTTAAQKLIDDELQYNNTLLKRTDLKGDDLLRSKHPWSADAVAFFKESMQNIPPAQREDIIHAFFKACPRIADDVSAPCKILPDMVAEALMDVLAACKMQAMAGDQLKKFFCIQYSKSDGKLNYKGLSVYCSP